MEKILNKMGIYDIISVWLSGVIMLFLTTTITNELFNWSILKYCYFANAIFIIAGGYFVGMVFQEIGNFLQRNILNKNSRIIKKVLSKEDESFSNRNMMLTDSERDFIVGYEQFQKENSNPEYIYNYCKYYVVSKADASSMDRNQVTAAISRSLAVYFAFLIIFIAISMLCITDKIVAKCIVAVVSVFLSILFFYRSYRFVRIRYIQYFRVFYFDQNL